MSVNVEFIGEDRHGVVAEGTYLWDAAKRMGVRLPAECEGRGECDTCAVTVREGATLLSSLTNAERERLSPERLVAGQRLACQAKIVSAGALVVEPVAQPEGETMKEEKERVLSKEFKNLPLQEKLFTLAELEIIALSSTWRAVSDATFGVFEKGLDAVVGLGRARERRRRAAHRPPEHTGASRKAGDAGKASD